MIGNAYRSEMFIFVLELNGASLFGHRLISRIVVASLMMSGCCGGVLGQLCGEDKFYDAVVDECALCSDVCNLCLAPESRSFCVRNCPGSPHINVTIAQCLRVETAFLLSRVQSFVKAPCNRVQRNLSLLMSIAACVRRKTRISTCVIFD